MDKSRTYGAEYKKEAVKLAKEVGAKKASESLKIPYGTLYDWIKKERKGALETGEASYYIYFTETRVLIKLSEIGDLISMLW